ncbi:MAG: hypothetical protein JEZ02_06790 [Desulfatibacillum sp.]|nr:hypothetical protein [Desulfatibacillum sp.]
MLVPKTIEQVLNAYHLEFSKERPDLPLEGSPQRSLERHAVEDSPGKIFIVEALEPGMVDRKETIAATLDKLSLAGLKDLAPYQRLKQGDHILSLEKGHYQVSPYEGSRRQNAGLMNRNRIRGGHAG